MTKVREHIIPAMVHTSSLGMVSTKGRILSHNFSYKQQLYTLNKHIVLVGIMGAGKTSIGRRLAKRLGLPFVDSDQEIEIASGYTIADFFDIYGEKAFREGEAKVISRLLDQTTPQVVSTGGGAYLHPQIRAKIRQRGIALWIRAELETLVRRVSRRDNRPLLNRGNQREVLARIMQDRYNIYQEANLTVDSEAEGPNTTVQQAIKALSSYLGSTEK